VPRGPAQLVPQNSAACALGPKASRQSQIRSTSSRAAHDVDERRMAVARTELPRKEVIQPHLPVRLPCYDFTPITSPTFDGSLPLRG
jgi:hypothetical protein